MMDKRPPIRYYDISESNNSWFWTVFNDYSKINVIHNLLSTRCHSTGSDRWHPCLGVPGRFKIIFHIIIPYVWELNVLKSTYIIIEK